MRILEGSHQAALRRCTRRTTIQILLGDGGRLNLSTADIELPDIIFLGKLAPVDELNLELTDATEGINLKISNVTLALGQNLINTPDILSGASAILGCYFRDSITGDEWHDVKLTGKITIGKIDKKWVDVFFESITSASSYKGQSIAELFPDSEIPAGEIPAAPVAPVANFNDLENVPGSRNLTRISPLLDDNQYGGRHFLPDFQNADL